MKFISIVGFLGLIGFATSATALPYEPRECPEAQNHFAVVTEHVHGSNNSVYCKLVTGETYTPKDAFEMKIGKHIDCSKNSVAPGDLILIAEGYYAMIDKLGNVRCMNSVSLVKVIGKASLTDF